MKEAQRYRASAVLESTDQAAAARKHDIGGAHLPFDHGIGAWLQRADRRDAGAILVAQRQMKQQILHGVDTEPGEFLGQARSHAVQRGDRDAVERG